jgi:hypothetical protein
VTGWKIWGFSNNKIRYEIKEAVNHKNHRQNSLLKKDIPPLRETVTLTGSVK